jgi:multidrug efflux pump subunit AcrA (membrane-fusion protein)
VQSITPKGDPVSRSYRVRVSLPTDTPLMIGMTAETNIVLSEKTDVLLVPATSVKDDKIQTVRNGAIHIQPIQTGAIGAEKTEIVSGISDNDNIVVLFDSTLEDGQKIRSQTKKMP